MNAAEIMKWKYPNWNEFDFQNNIDNYRQTRPIEISQAEKEDGIKEAIYYEIRSKGEACARLSPKEYYNLRADIVIEEANKLENLELRLGMLRKAKSDIGVHINSDIEYSGDLYKKYFDISEIYKKLDARINNLDAAIQYKLLIEKSDKKESKGEINSKITHRVHALVHNYKVKAGLAKQLTRTEMRSEGGKNREKAFDSLNSASKAVFRPANQVELMHAIDLLSAFPTAKKAAINDLDKMEKS